MSIRVVRRKGTANLYLRGTILGQHVFESTGTSHHGLAEEARIVREHELMRTALHGPQHTTTFAAAAESYLTAEARSDTTRLHLRRLLEHFGPHTRLAEIDQTAIDRAYRTVARQLL